jgi:AcrR family transcriptional regulator
MPKSEVKNRETAERILNAALAAFRERGFAAATMREIAQRAGVATGAAYYYYPSKDAIVMAFYQRASEEIAVLAARAVEDAGVDLRRRLTAAIEVKFRYFAESRELLAALASHVDPAHPLSPFSEETREIRERDIATFARAVEGGKQKTPKDLIAVLPRLLWLYQMGLILFWTCDRSEGQRRTGFLVERSLALVVKLIRISALPLMRPLRRQVIELAQSGN